MSNHTTGGYGSAQRARHPAGIKPGLAAATGLALVLAFAVPSASTAAPVLAPAGTDIVFTPTEASWTTERHPETPQAKYPYLSTTKSADATYLKFGTDIVGPNRKIVAATLEFTIASTAATRAGVQVYPASSAWTSSLLTRSNQPVHQNVPLSDGSIRAVAGTTIRVPLGNLNAISTTGPSSFEVGYTQAGVGTTFKKGVSGPRLHLVVQDARVTSPTVAPTPPPANPAALPFAVEPIGTTNKKVFAHYFPPYPVSFDNKPPASDYYAVNYLSPNGENGKHALYGGLLRDRPEGRSPLSGNWQATDFLDEVNDAADAGIDGFTVDIMGLSGQNWNRTVGVMQAAAAANRHFVVVPNVDASAAAGAATPTELALKLSQLFASPAAYRLSTGEYVLSSFKAEAQSPQWWSCIETVLQKNYGIKVAFIAVFNNASDANMRSFAPISYALSNWGARTPVTIASGANNAAKARALGVKWMSPVAVQDARPNGGKYAEAGNTETLRASWKRAIDDGADFVQMATWNDYSESTAFAPSEAHGTAFLDINAYYARQFKKGSTPAVTGDALYLTHRIQPFAAQPSVPSRLMLPTLDGTFMAPRDTVEVLTVLRAPASVTVSIGGVKHSIDAPAGLSAVTFPLLLGSVSATASRGGVPIASVNSPFPIVATPSVQDLQYYAVSSRGKY